MWPCICDRWEGACIWFLLIISRCYTRCTASWAAAARALVATGELASSTLRWQWRTAPSKLGTLRKIPAPTCLLSGHCLPIVQLWPQRSEWLCWFSRDEATWLLGRPSTSTRWAVTFYPATFELGGSFQWSSSCSGQQGPVSLAQPCQKKQAQKAALKLGSCLLDSCAVVPEKLSTGKEPSVIYGTSSCGQPSVCSCTAANCLASCGQACWESAFSI